MKQNIILRIFLRLKETIIFCKIKSSLEGFVRNLLIISFSLQKVIMLRSSYRQEVLKILWISLFDSPNILNHLGKNYLTISNSDELGLQWHTTYNIKKYDHLQSKSHFLRHFVNLKCVLGFQSHYI